MSIIVFILILSGLVILHEFGHYIVAKRNGIRVDEFGIGYPPRLFGKKIGDTLYSVNLLPFGGFVSIAGGDVENENEEKELLADPKSFVSKSPWKKAKVIVAGALMNLLVGAILFYIFLIFNNYKSFYIPQFFKYDFSLGDVETINTVIFDMSENSAAQKSQMEIGDAVLEIDGVKVEDVQDVRDQLSGKIDQQVEIKVLDLKDRSYNNYKTVYLIPDISDSGEAILGVYLGKSTRVSYGSTFLQKLFSGFSHVYNMVAYSLSAFSEIIGLSVATKDISPVSESVAGPVGIYNVFDSVVKYGGSKVVLGLIDTVALVSLGFAITNLLPLPALDGGRLLFIAIEGITKKKINPKIESIVHRAGMGLLLILVVLITIKDIFK